MPCYWLCRKVDSCCTVSGSMPKNYIHRSVGRLELEALVPLAVSEEASFFARNPHLVQPYRSRLICASLCQGAALQYLGRGYGVNDFDVHFFYRQNPAKPRLSRTVKRVWTTVGNFRNVAVDFVRTVIPTGLCAESEAPVELVRKFLLHPPTDNAHHIAQKAVVGLLPLALVAVVIWPLDGKVVAGGCATPRASLMQTLSSSG
jgi:hypothetical protein